MKMAMKSTQKNILRELYKKKDLIKRTILESISKNSSKIENAAL